MSTHPDAPTRIDDILRGLMKESLRNPSTEKTPVSRPLPAEPHPTSPALPPSSPRASYSNSGAQQVHQALREHRQQPAAASPLPPVDQVQPNTTTTLPSRGLPVRRLAAVAAAVVGVVAVVFGVRVYSSQPQLTEVKAASEPATTSATRTGWPVTPTGATSSPEVSSTTLMVHVVGRVTSPGVYTIAGDQRVKDAIQAAGGLLKEADRARVNQARKVRDGELIVIPAVGESLSTRAELGLGAAPGSTSAVINLNSATATELEALPGIGPVTAGRIVSYREQHGPFASVDALRAVHGIGPSLLKRLHDRVGV